VSNQDAVVQTDSSGAFRIAPSATGVVFVSIPDGYRAAGPFWRRTRDSTATMDFALERSPVPRVFTFAHASDTHIAPANVERTRKLRAIVDSLEPDFLIVTGDLVRDALRVSAAEATGYYELFRDERARFATPVWTVPGNHEIFGIERKLSHVDPSHPLFGREMYRHYFGPDYYSFTRGGVHFVGLNTVDIDGESYYGHVDSLQLAWLARDLAAIPVSMPVVTFNHIPFVSAVDQLRGPTDEPPAPTLITVNGRTHYRHLVSNALDVLTVLRTRPHVMALGGHLHVRETLFYETEGVRTLFAQSAATVAPTPMAPLIFRSGVTLYAVRNGTIDAGRFVPLDGRPAARP
jgi:3',5'-cyclic AMP phosphodiesterase CpdA